MLEEIAALFSEEIKAHSLDSIIATLEKQIQLQHGLSLDDTQILWLIEQVKSQQK